MTTDALMTPSDFRAALEKGYFAKVTKAIKAGQSMEEQPNLCPIVVSALRCQRGTMEQRRRMVQQVLGAGGDVQAITQTLSVEGPALSEWVAKADTHRREDDPGVLELLMAHGADPWRQPHPATSPAPLFSALMYAPNVFPWLLAYASDADICQQEDAVGYTLLHRAAQFTGQPKDWERRWQPLLERGADVHRPNREGRSALEMLREAAQTKRRQDFEREIQAVLVRVEAYVVHQTLSEALTEDTPIHTPRRPRM